MCTCDQEVQFGSEFSSDDDLTICSRLDSDDYFSDCEDYCDCYSSNVYQESPCVCYRVINVEAGDDAEHCIHIEDRAHSPNGANGGCQCACLVTIDQTPKTADNVPVRIRSKSQNKSKNIRFCNRIVPKILKEPNFITFTHSLSSGLNNMEIIAKPLKPKSVKARPKKMPPKLKIAVSKRS
ncbi:hypothetical protein BEWA_022110 [Theileria equi strain WA]|uniref:Uncharacterized protein n=1 Tax=Theileria equi strain WA TaxID=1537102 RepID=L0AVV0_THEEQ|nr:hypothetical protein BEWA_022110 [Theileria equi strain WA]AFZ79363.1 hypothetical protein BEWA_022110 [Theileria equi strain WA]|eukprot:XP_004829029.1 hypothetical protein BEWA_022110 [Theileria equi strain WA]